MRWTGLPAHHRWLEAETDRLLDFSRGARHPGGGFAWLDDGGAPLDRPLELWITCRMTHVHALGHLMGRPGCGELVDHGLAALTDRFADATHGGWYARVGADEAEGPLVRDKTAYEHAFVVLAASSATAAGRPGAPRLLDRALEVLLTRFWDDDAGMVVEQWDESFTHLDGYRGINSTMHAVEAMLAAADVTGDNTLLERARRATLNAFGHAAANDGRLPEHFDETWTPRLDYNVDEPAHPFRPYGGTVGHWFEWARLGLHARAADPRHRDADRLLAGAVGMFDAAVRDGWHVDGAPGFVYTVDWSGSPVVRARMHWVAAEAVAAAYALWRATGEDSYVDAYERWWDHVDTCFRDTARGSWTHELDADLRPAHGTWEGKPDTYHAVQATLLPRLDLDVSLAAALQRGALS